MSNRRRMRILAIGAALAFGITAAAVVPVSDDRRVTEFSGDGLTELTPAAPFAPFMVTGQSTTVSADQFAGSGSGYGESDFLFFIRESYFDVTFDVQNATDMSLTGDYEASAGDFGYAEVRVRLYDETQGGGQLYGSTLASDFDPVADSFAHAQTLTPGTYRLLIETSITPGGFDTYGLYAFSATFTPQAPTDSDGDGVDDATDNCILTANSGQTDADGDGYGNACDADLDNDCVVNVVDLGLLRAVFFSNDPVADFNGDGIVNAIDLGIMKTGFFGAPGPSAGGACP